MLKLSSGRNVISAVRSISQMYGIYSWRSSYFHYYLFKRLAADVQRFPCNYSSAQIARHVIHCLYSVHHPSKR